MTTLWAKSLQLPMHSTLGDVSHLIHFKRFYTPVQPFQAMCGLLDCHWTVAWVDDWSIELLDYWAGLLDSPKLQNTLCSVQNRSLFTQLLR